MTPSLTMDSSPDTVSAAFVFSGETRHCFTGVKSASELLNERFGKSMLFAMLSMWLSSFRCRILAILKVCPKPEMVRIYARWIVTSGAIMEDMKSSRNGTIQKLPCNPWRSVSSEHSEKSITILVLKSGPQPARISLINKFPKPNFWWSLPGVIRTAFRAAKEAQFSDKAFSFLELLTASDTLNKHLKPFLLGVKGPAASTAGSEILACLIRQSNLKAYG